MKTRLFLWLWLGCISITLAQNNCANAGFETGTFDGYQFARHEFIPPNPTKFSPCNANTSVTDVNYNITLNPNQTNDLTIMNAGNDPILAALGVDVPMTFEGSQHSLRIHDTSSHNKKITSVITTTDNNVSDVYNMNISVVLREEINNPIPSLEYGFFTVKYLVDGAVVGESCIDISDDNCAFNSVVDSQNNFIWHYTGWQCLPGLLSNNPDPNIPMEIRISLGSSGYGQSLAYAYIDNVRCDPECSIEPEVSIAVNEIEVIPCPDDAVIINGVYELPFEGTGQEGTLDELTATLNPAGPGSQINIPQSAISFANGQFEIDLSGNSLPPEGCYTVTVNAEFSIGCSLNPLIIGSTIEASYTSEEFCIEACCTPVSCPDFSVDKRVLSNFPGAFTPGSEITYQICVWSEEPEGTCPFQVSIEDIIDTSILDPGSFNTNTLSVQFNDPVVSINSITLNPGDSRCFQFSFTIREDTQAEVLENCAIAVLSSPGCEPEPQTDCVTSTITYPNINWPRTYGGASRKSRTSNDVTTDPQGKIYTAGRILNNDTSNEDASFLSTGTNFLMRHSTNGDLDWVTYTTDEIFEIEVANGWLYAAGKDTVYVYTINETTQSFDLLDSYFLGNIGDTNLLMDVGEDNHVYIGTKYTNSYSAPNGDFSIVATQEDQLVAIFSFSTTLVAPLAFCDLETIFDTFHVIDNGTSEITIHDIVHEANNNKLYITGFSRGDIVFPCDRSPEGESEGFYYLISFDTDDMQCLTCTLNYYGDENYLGQLAFSNNLNKLYVQHEEKLFSHDLLNFYTYSYIHDLTNIDGSTTKDLVVNQQTGDIYRIGNHVEVTTNYGDISKVTDGVFDVLFWERSIAETNFQALAVENSNYMYLTGEYYADTQFEANDQFIFHYGGFIDTFIARLEDEGNTGVFKMPSEEVNIMEDQNKYSVYPNPTKDSFRISATSDLNLENIHVKVVSMTGEIIFEKSSYTVGEPLNSIGNIPSGLYFVMIQEGNTTKEIHKLIIDK